MSSASEIWIEVLLTKNIANAWFRILHMWHLISPFAMVLKLPTCRQPHLLVLMSRLPLAVQIHWIFTVQIYVEMATTINRFLVQTDEQLGIYWSLSYNNSNCCQNHWAIYQHLNHTCLSQYAKFVTFLTWGQSKLGSVLSPCYQATNQLLFP